jgi:hypothetical protein
MFNLLPSFSEGHLGKNIECILEKNIRIMLIDEFLKIFYGENLILNGLHQHASPSSSPNIFVYSNLTVLKKLLCILPDEIVF